MLYTTATVPLRLLRVLVVLGLLSLWGAGPAVAAPAIDDEPTTWLGEQSAALAGYWAPIVGPRTFREPTLAWMPADRFTDPDCRGEIRARSVAVYCVRSETIWVSASALQQLDATSDGYAAWVILGHEYGHHIQQLTRARFTSTFAAENQADCLAGASLQSRLAANQIRLDEAISGIVGTISLAGDAPGVTARDRGAHGQVDQRVAAFAAGYADLANCELA
jgi:predicted metalloprotease